MTFTHKQKAAIGGGLQAHSVGSLYPLVVVGIDHYEHGLRWVVQNVQTGQYAAFSTLEGHKEVPAFVNAAYAGEFAQRIADGIRHPWWAAGPLSRDADGRLLIVAQQQETPRQAFYNSFDTDTNSG